MENEGQIYIGTEEQIQIDRVIRKHTPLKMSDRYKCEQRENTNRNRGTNANGNRGTNMNMNRGTNINRNRGGKYRWEQGVKYE